MDNEELVKIRLLLESLVKRQTAKDLKELPSNEKRIYELTGKIGQTEMVKKLKISSKTISKAWKNLEEKGLLKKEGSKYKKMM
ncbi:MAG: hypothetical protein Q7J54_02155 [Candidatus Woesearchaeota archaeon]|nr:hypothetical protein [Candidatus Woesearchaeota archaeon]